MSVDENGVLTARGTGRAVVTVYLGEEALTECAVTVVKAPRKLSFPEATLILSPGEGRYYPASLPKGTAGAVSYASDDPAVLAVDGAGLVSALAPGQATITAMTDNGKRATCRVTVLDAAGGGVPILGDSRGKLEIHFVSVGNVYDDVIILRNDEGAILIDGGRERSDDHYGRTRVIHEYLRAMGVEKLDYVIGSHLDENHVGAAAWLTDHMPVGAAYNPVDVAACPEKWCEDAARAALLHAMGNTDVRVARAGETCLRLGDLEVCFIGTRQEDFLETANSTSIINLVRFGNNRFLFTGDQAAVGEEVHLAHMAEDAAKFGFSSLKVDMVKWPHHGNCDPAAAFWAATNPELIVVPNNGKSGSPDSGAWRNARHAAPNARLLKLSHYSAITLVSDGSAIEVYCDVEPGRWRRG